MAIPPPSFPLRRTAPLAWRPLTDAEWHALEAVLRRGGPGRPARDLRLTWDGIFWMACSKGPWRDLPAVFGKPDSAHRTLRRAAAARLLHRMLLAVSDHPLFAGDPLKAIAWFIVRAFRRAFRVAPFAIAYARRLGLASALPCEPFWLPQPDLSEGVARAARIMQQSDTPRPMALLRALFHLFRRAAGEPRFWRTTG